MKMQRTSHHPSVHPPHRKKTTGPEEKRGPRCVKEGRRTREQHHTTSLPRYSLLCLLGNREAAEKRSVRAKETAPKQVRPRVCVCVCKEGDRAQPRSDRANTHTHTRAHSRSDGRPRLCIVTQRSVCIRSFPFLCQSAFSLKVETKVERFARASQIVVSQE